MFDSNLRNGYFVEDAGARWLISQKVVLSQREIGPRLTFEVHEAPELGAVRLKLTGDLDLGSVVVLKSRLRELRAEGRPVRLDLSELEFMDSTGLHALVQASEDARRDGWQLGIEPVVAPQVRRLFELVKFDRFLSEETNTRS